MDLRWVLIIKLSLLLSLLYSSLTWSIPWPGGISFAENAIKTIRDIFPEVIYGVDNRRDYEFFDQTELIYAQSVAAVIPKNRLEFIEDLDAFQIVAPLLKEKRNLCEGVRFSQEYSLATCSAFLVAPNILATANHCARDLFDCQDKYWVFDFNDEELAKQDGNKILKEKVFTCKRIIKGFYDRKYDRNKFEEINLGKRFQYENKGVDFSLVELTEVVAGRKPLALNENGGPMLDETVWTIGHPAGVSVKIADSAVVTIDEEVHFFESNLDSFFGNSGGPVINTKTGLVEGIAVRGKPDWVKNGDCMVENKVKDELDYLGVNEDAVRITEIIPYLPGRKQN